MPRCPIWRKPIEWRTASTTSCDVLPCGLSIDQRAVKRRSFGLLGQWVLSLAIFVCGVSLEFNLTANYRPRRRTRRLPRAPQLCGGGFVFFTSFNSSSIRCTFSCDRSRVKCNSGKPPQLQALDQLAANITSGMFQRLDASVCSVDSCPARSQTRAHASCPAARELR